VLSSASQPARGAQPDDTTSRTRLRPARRPAAKFAESISQVALTASPARGLPRIPNEIAFLVYYGVSSARLAIAMRIAQTQGVTADRVLIAEGHVTEDHFYRALARHLRISFISADAKLHSSTAYESAIASGILPLAPGQGATFLLAPRGPAISLLIAAATRWQNRPVNFALTTPRHLSWLARRAAAAEIQKKASHALKAADPSLCAKDGLNRRQAVTLTVLASALAFILPLAPLDVLIFGTTIICLAVLATICLRLSACASSSAPLRRSRSLTDAELPDYSIIVPLFREAKVLPQLIAALNALDYPRAKLDVKIVVEEDDFETGEALQNLGLPPFCEVIVAPEGLPRTKPRALNVALPILRGALAAVFDAEDIPEPQQLRLAAARFAAAGPSLACVQARLAIDNLHDGWLARLFAIEYAGLFDVLNTGFMFQGIPFPLGGSSNHFRTEILRHVGGWDAWNVTEDADIGLRLTSFGFQVECLDSTTYEEAPKTLRSFFNQRRRWCKGWYQTLIVLWRRPLRLWRSLGASACAMLSLVVMSNVIGALVAPLFVAGLAVDILLGSRALPPGIAGDVLASLWSGIMLAGAPAVLAPGLIGMKRRKMLRSWPGLALLPAYIAIICAAAWTALVDLARNPHYWHKTEHGTARRGYVPGSTAQRLHSANWVRAFKNWRLTLSDISM
jgi:glycosyltransferase XagB